MKALAICMWGLAWCFAGLIPASLFAARDGKQDRARAELAMGIAGAAGFAIAGAALW